MPTTVAENRAEPWFRRLYLPAYTVVDAARYSGTHPNTVARWHYDQHAVLPGHEKKTPLSYLELVEVAFVAFFRQLKVPMKRIKSAREYIKTRFTVEYPMAHYKFKTEGFHVLMDFEQIEPSGFDRFIVADAHGQMAWQSMMDKKLAEFDYEKDLALTWHVAGRQSPIVLDPRVAFGAPVIRGIPTWVIKGRHEADEPVTEICQDFALTQEEILEGLRFE